MGTASIDPHLLKRPPPTGTKGLLSDEVPPVAKRVDLPIGWAIGSGEERSASVRHNVLVVDEHNDSLGGIRVCHGSDYMHRDGSVSGGVACLFRCTWPAPARAWATRQRR